MAGLSPEFALVQMLETVPGLQNKTNALQPKRDVKPPFAFYVSETDDEDQALDGGTGLMRYNATLHLVESSFRGLQLLCAWARAAILAMRRGTYSTPENDDGAPRGRILVEDAGMTQSSPDLYEAEVGYYRRMYSIRIDYQIEEVYTGES